ncbi:MAG TPA: hypothetical protein VNW97_10780 [Candidatus Saccharimonadales bacterium]|nr:hypothetical protein [Candidatus Saccharimonadales bacterium]
MLKGMLSLPVAGALGCRPEDEPNEGPAPSPDKGKLHIVLNGAFAVVIQKNARNRLRVFSPREPSNLHEFYFNDPYAAEDRRKSHNFELLPDGLAPSPKLAVDDQLRAINKSTDLWCQDDYFVTIDSPAPQRIGFVPPLHDAVLVSGEKIKVPAVLVLEFGVTNPDKVRIISQDSKPTPPLRFAELIERYGKRCSEKGEERFRAECNEMKKRFESQFRRSDLGYFFGVGLNHRDAEHAKSFFNKQVLASFPHLAKSLELSSIDAPSAYQKQTLAPSPRMVSAVWQPEMQTPRLLQVASVYDCTIAGPIVTQPAGTGG